MTDPHDLLTIEEAAELLRTPVATLRFWRFKETNSDSQSEEPTPPTGPHSFKVGRRVRYRRQDVLDWIDAQAAKSGGAA